MRWTCAACADVMEGDLEDVAWHLDVHHGYDVDRWPDGKPVVIDETLEPYEFERVADG